ncbi:hypothetical protein [Knoellia sp. LjRoot47]|uniref:hypothetical protein n=1 Tax=Knoellia sp. LjRoot47 TaxID=3342330 RepID=UPI003ECE5F1C
MKAYGNAATIPGGTRTGIPLPKGPVVHAGGHILDRLEREHTRVSPIVMHNPAEFTPEQLARAGYAVVGTKTARRRSTYVGPNDDRIAQLHRQGLTLQDIADDVDMTPAGVRGVLDRLGIERPKRVGRRGKLVTVTDDTLRALYVEDGLSCREIGERFDSSESAISRRLRAIPDLTMRTKAITPARCARRPDLDRDAIVAQYEAGDTAKAVAERHQCSDRTVLTILHQRGVAIRGRSSYDTHFTPRPARIDLDKAVLERLYVDEQRTAYEIADELEVSLSTVRRQLRHHDIPLRDDRARNGRRRQSLDGLRDTA